MESPDDVFTSKSSTDREAMNESKSNNNELSIAFSDCEQVFLKAHKFLSAMPPISISNIHTSHVVGQSKTSKVLKKGKTIKSRLKPSKGRSKIVYREPVIACNSSLLKHQ